MPTPSIKETISAHDEGEDLPRMCSERELFEEYERTHHWQGLERFGDTYKNATVRNRWVGWQAKAIRPLSAAPQSDGWRPKSLAEQMGESLLLAPTPAKTAVSQNPAAWLHYAPKKPQLRRVDFSPTATVEERGNGWVTVALGPLPTPPKMTQGEES